LVRRNGDTYGLRVCLARSGNALAGDATQGEYNDRSQDSEDDDDDEEFNQSETSVNLPRSPLPLKSAISLNHALLPFVNRRADTRNSPWFPANGKTIFTIDPFK